MVTNRRSRSNNRQIQLLSNEAKIKKEPQTELDNIVPENIGNVQVRKKKLKDDSDKWDQNDWEKVQHRRELARLRQRRFRQKHNRQTKGERKRVKLFYAEISDTQPMPSTWAPNTIDSISVDLSPNVSKGTEAMRRYRKKIKADSEKWDKYKSDQAERNKKYRRQIDDLERLERQRQLARIRQRRFREKHNTKQKHNESKKAHQTIDKLSKKYLNSDIANNMNYSSIDLTHPQKDTEVVRSYRKQIKNESEKFDKFQRKQNEKSKKYQKQFDELERLERRRKLARLRQRRFRERHKQKVSLTKTEYKKKQNLNLSNKNVLLNKIDTTNPEIKHTVVKIEEDLLMNETNMPTENKSYINNEKCELQNTKEILDSHQMLNITDYLSVELTFEDSENPEECKEEHKDDSEKFDNYIMYQRRINFLEKLYRQRESCRLRQQRFREKHKQKLYPSRKSISTADKLQRQRENARIRQRRFREKQKLISAQTSANNPENLNINILNENVLSNKIKEISTETQCIDIKKRDCKELQKEEQQGNISREINHPISENDVQHVYNRNSSPERIIQPQIQNVQNNIRADLPFKLSKNPDIMRRYRRILKDDLEKWEDYKINGMERNIKYQRQADFLVSLQRHRELSRLRQQRFREKKKFKYPQLLINDLEDTDTNEGGGNIDDADMNVTSGNKDTYTIIINKNLEDAGTNIKNENLDTNTNLLSENLIGATTNFPTENLESTDTIILSRNLKGADTNIKSENLEDTTANLLSKNLIDAATNIPTKNLEGADTIILSRNLEGGDSNIKSENLINANLNVETKIFEGMDTNISENLENTNISGKNLMHSDINETSKNLEDANTNVTNKDLEKVNSNKPNENVESQQITALLIFPDQPIVHLTLNISDEAEVMKLYKKNVIDYLEKWVDFKRRKAEIRKSLRQVNDFEKQQHHRELSRVRQRRYRERNKRKFDLSRTSDNSLKSLKTNVQTESA